MIAETETQSKLPPAFAAELRVVLAGAQAKYPRMADGLSRANAVLQAGRLIVSPDGMSALVRPKPEATAGEEAGPYQVDSTCTCPGTRYAPDDICKHRLALWLHKLTTRRLGRTRPLMDEDAPQTEVERPPSAALPQEEGVLTELATIPAQFIQMMHGKPHVLYKGLLAMAHERGLVRLEARLVSVTADLALAEATATFADGRVFTEASDASPQNVGTQIRAHFPRMALTRSKARCLRDALNIGVAAVEEMD